MLSYHSFLLPALTDDGPVRAPDEASPLCQLGSQGIGQLGLVCVDGGGNPRDWLSSLPGSILCEPFGAEPASVGNIDPSTMLLPRAGVKYYTTATQIGQGQQVCRLPRSIDLAVFVLNPQATLSIVSCMRGSTATSQTMGLVAHYELLSREYWGMGVHDAGGNVLRPLIDGCRKQVPSSSYTVSEVDG